MKKLILSVAMSLPSLTMASGRDIVDTVEADRLVSDMVNAVIKSYDLQCRRPDLLKSRANLNVQEYKIQYRCRSSWNPEKGVTISVAGDIEDSQVLVTEFVVKK